MELGIFYAILGAALATLLVVNIEPCPEMFRILKINCDRFLPIVAYCNQP